MKATKRQSNISVKSTDKMNNNEIIQNWLNAFGKGVSKKIIEEHVTSYGNHLWHLFTWANVRCLEGEEARKAFDELQYTEAIRFSDGYSNRIDNVAYIEKTSSAEIDKYTASDVYVAAKDFSWTYVRTHEQDFGPYLCKNK